MHNPYIFFSDLDGTLLTDEKKISAETMQALIAFAKAGNRFVVCTGRPLASSLYVVRDYELDALPGLFIVSFNGAQIFDMEKKETVHRDIVPFQTAQKVFDEAERFGLHCQTYSDTHMIARRDNDNLRYNQRIARMEVLFTDDLKSVLPVEPCKMLVIDLKDTDRLERFRLHMEPLIGDTMTLMYSEPFYLEIFPKTAGKGTGLKRLCDHLGMPVSYALAAGDAENDISMIEAAGCGIAMKNAPARVREAADYVTETDNNHDGLVPFFLHPEQFTA